MNGVVFFELLVIDDNKRRFMVFQCDIYTYIYIYISYGMYDQHICKSYTYDGLGVSENVSSPYFVVPPQIYIYRYCIYTYICIYIYIHMNTYIYMSCHDMSCHVQSFDVM